jgi:hypothetical protein
MVDHNDMKAFSSYPDKAVPVLAEPKAAERIRGAGFTRVHSIDIWSSAGLGPVTATVSVVLFVVLCVANAMIDETCWPYFKRKMYFPLRAIRETALDQWQLPRGGQGRCSE